jgi:hypothetical protein
MMKLEQATPYDWPAAEGYLSAALAETSDWALEDVALAVVRGTVGLYLVKASAGDVIGALALQVIPYPKRKVLDVLLFSGYGDWGEAMEQLKELARTLGCVALVGRGRKGWARRLEGALPLYHWELPIGASDDEEND